MEAKYTYTGAISHGWAARFIGESLPNSAVSFSANEEGISGVQIGPGATELTRMPPEIIPAIDANSDSPSFCQSEVGLSAAGRRQRQIP